MARPWVRAVGHKGWLFCLLFPFLGISFNSCLLLVGPSSGFASSLSCPLVFVSQKGRRGLGEQLALRCSAKELTNGAQGGQDQDPSPPRKPLSLAQLWERFRYFTKFNNTATMVWVF